MPPRSRKTKPVERRRPGAGAPADNADGNNAEGDAFHFVNVNPTSEEQKSENRSVIRSHASKYIWRQHRAVRADGAIWNNTSPTTVSRSRSNTEVTDPDPTTSSSTGHQPSSQPMPETETLQSAPYSAPAPGTDQDWKALSQDAEFEVTAVDPSAVPLAAECPTYGDDEEPESSDLTSASQPSEDLSYAEPPGTDTHPGGVPTPFNQLMAWIGGDSTLPTFLGESAMSKLMRYAAFDVWPGLVPGAGGQEWTQESAPNAWLPRALKNQALYTALLYGAAGHMQTRKRLEGAAPLPQTREEINEQIICENETVKRLNKLVMDPVESSTDETILAVLCMAFNKTDYRSWSGSDPYPQPPLRNLQWLDVYGGLSLNNAHVMGLLALLKNKGLEQVKLPGLAETLSVSSIMLSTKNLMPSQLPFIPIFKGTAKGQTPGWPALSQPMMGVGMFEDDTVDPISNVGLPEALAKVMRDMRDYNAVVNLYCQGLLSKLSGAVIADRRNHIQYNLLALRQPHVYGSQFMESHRTYEPCRLAAMIYSMLIIFPLPARNRPFGRLAGQLRLALTECGTTANWHGSPAMLLWVLMMGCIAAQRSLFEQWFICVFRDVIVAQNIPSWDELKPSLMAVVWLDNTCDMRGRAIWDEVSKKFGQNDEPLI